MPKLILFFFSLVLSNESAFHTIRRYTLLYDDWSCSYTFYPNGRFQETTPHCLGRTSRGGNYEIKSGVICILRDSFTVSNSIDTYATTKENTRDTLYIENDTILYTMNYEVFKHRYYLRMEQSMDNVPISSLQWEKLDTFFSKREGNTRRSWKDVQQRPHGEWKFYKEGKLYKYQLYREGKLIRQVQH